MLITVAVPVYNAERYIRQSIESVLAQTYTDFELIVTDDGSTDGTIDIIRSFDDPRLKVVCDGQHKGLAIRLNEQIASARGEYFVRMDADDVMLPHRLERQVAFIREHPETDVVGSGAIIIDEQGKKIGWRSTGEWQRGANRKAGDLSYAEVTSFMHPTVMGRTEWFRKYYYNPACEGCEDRDLWLRSYKMSHFYSLYEPLLLYRDSQRLNLDTYLFRQKKGRYVLKLNSSNIDWWQYQSQMWGCRMRAVIASVLHLLGLSKWQLGARNVKHSSLNNHLLHVITSLRTGGAEKLMVDLLPRLRKCGYEVELAVFDGVKTPFYEELEKQEITIHSFGQNSNVYNPFHIFRLWRLMRHADIVHTHNTSPQLFAAIANLFAGATLITTEHNTTNRRRDKSFFKPIDRWMYKQYSRIICISDQARTNLEDYLPETNTKNATVFNGIDIGRFLHKSFIEHKNNEIVVTMVAAFRAQKDQKTLIKAFSLLPDNYMLQLVGTGEEDLISDCKNLVIQNNISDRIKFLGMRNDVPEILSSSDIIVLSSHYEGLSLSSLEGMASGKPFVASDVEGLHEIVDGYGILVPENDPRAMADAIKQLADNPDYAARIAENCVARAKMFDISSMAEKYNDLYS